MRAEKVLSFYNLQNEEELEELMDGMKGLKYEKISSFEETGAAVYRLYIGEQVNSVRLMNILTFFMRKNDNSRFRISKVRKFVVY